MDPDPEKGLEDGPPKKTRQSSVNFLTHEFSRPGEIIRPGGKKTHIAGSPAEIDGLRRKLSTVEPVEDFDIVVHGSVEHVEALRDAQKHHSELRAQLHEKFGDDAEEFERIVRELDRLNSDLNAVSHNAVNLDANFTKFGYSAHLRTIDKSGENSETTSLSDKESIYMADKPQGVHIPFYKTPVIRQYFHKGLLWRASETAEVASYELFFDLLYVGILAVAGDGAAETHNGEGLLRFVITFFLTWKIWSDLSQVLAWLVMDDVIRRLSMLFMMVILLGLVTNMNGSFEHTWTPLIAFYVAGRWYMSTYFMWMAWLIPMVRPAMIGSAIVIFVPGLIWIGTIYLENYLKQAVVWVAIFFDLVGPVALVSFQLGRGPLWPAKLKEWSKKVHEFIPGNNIEHRIERMNAFVALVFGYSVVAILYQSSVAFGINLYFGKAVLGLIQSFAFNWLYFEIDVHNMHAHAIRRHYASAGVWISTHLPFVMAFTLAGASLAKLVIAHDLHDSEVEDLLEPYDTRSEEEVPSAIVWFYCVGLGIALACTGVIALSHQTRNIPNVRLTRPYRMAFRFVVSLVLVLLPLARHHLNSLDVVAITSCLVVLVLMIELIGSACPGESWRRKGKVCSYSAHAKMSKKELQQKMMSGEVVNVEEVAKKTNRRQEVHHDITV